jgi:hypothetical protein
MLYFGRFSRTSAHVSAWSSESGPTGVGDGRVWPFGRLLIDRSGCTMEQRALHSGIALRTMHRGFRKIWIRAMLFRFRD